MTGRCLLRWLKDLGFRASFIRVTKPPGKHLRQWAFRLKFEYFANDSTIANLAKRIEGDWEMAEQKYEIGMIGLGVMGRMVASLIITFDLAMTQLHSAAPDCRPI